MNILTKMILNIWTDRSWLTVLTQIKLLQVLAYSVDPDQTAPGLCLQCRPRSNWSRSWPTVLTPIKLVQFFAYSVDPDQTAPGLGLQCWRRSNSSRSWPAVLTQIKLLQEQVLHCLSLPSGQIGLWPTALTRSNWSRSWPTVLTQIKLLQEQGLHCLPLPSGQVFGLQCWTDQTASWPTALTQIKLVQVLAYMSCWPRSNCSRSRVYTSTTVWSTPRS